MRSLIHCRFFVLLCSLCLIGFSFIASVHGQEIPEEQNATATWDQFDNLVKTIQRIEVDLAEARKKLVAAKFEDQKTAAQESVRALNNELSALQLALEMWATGGVDVQALNTGEKQEKFNWRSELESVFEPLVVELRRITERPRKIERLRSEQIYYQNSLASANAALNSIAALRSKAPNKTLSKAFGDIEARWMKRRDSLQGRLDLINFELNELLAPSTPGSENTISALQKLFSGRILNFVLAVLAAVTVYWLVIRINRFYTNRIIKREKTATFAARIAQLLMAIVGVFFALLAAMVVLYMRGDWILLGLLIIILVAMILTMQRSIPGYLAEARLLLNIGPVRENERVIYNGLPWRVKTLGVFAVFENPLLSGGILRLPLNEVIGLTSRPYDGREDWFPTRENDFVVLNETAFGRVVLQTPEIVQVRIGGAVTSYPAVSFVGMNPRNLSLDGFTVVARFGLDYQHQAEVTGAIREQAEAFIGERVNQLEMAQYLDRFFVEFTEAGVNSLDFIAVCIFKSPAAEFYSPIQRFLQKTIVEACNHYGWSIPFNQLTVHMAGQGNK